MPWCTPLTQTGKDTKTQETTSPGYRGETPVITPTVLHVSDKWDFAKWGGDSSRPDRPSAGLLLNATRGSARWALPLSLSVWCSRTAPPTAAGIHWALRRPGGRRSAHRRTIPRRRSAAPSRQGKRPFVGCGIAAKPARRSPQAAANRQRLPPRVGAPAVAAPRGGKRQQSGRSSARCGSETGSEPAACRPCHAGSPGTPAHAHPPRSSGPGVSARSLLRPGHHAGRARTHSAAPAAVLAP